MFTENKPIYLQICTPSPFFCNQTCKYWNIPAGDNQAYVYEGISSTDNEKSTKKKRRNSSVKLKFLSALPVFYQLIYII